MGTPAFRALCAFLLAAAGSGMAYGQGDKGSLTEQFPKLSAKERSRIAAKETEEAGKDAAYQTLMKDGERAFQEGRYEEALTDFEQARALRPYNVYPKVKIEDLRALMARASEEPAVAPSAVVAEPPPPAPAPIPLPEQRVEPIISEAVSPPAITMPEPVREKPPTTVNAENPPAPRLEDLKPANTRIERRYKEGHAFVIERVVSLEGRSVVYKRVFHNWGQVYYFEDGLAVDERVWKARFRE